MPPAAPDRTVTRAGSIAHRIATLVRHVSEDLGHGVLVGDARAAFEREHGALPDAFDAMFFSLARRGVLVREAGRTSRTRYIHRDSRLARRARAAVKGPGRELACDLGPDVSGDLDDDALKVLRALRVAVVRLGRMVTTREVTTTLRDLGLRLTSDDPNAVRVRLMTLARERKHGLAAWSAPLVESEDVPTLAGRPSRRWRPAHSAVLPEPAAATAAEALRAVVAHVQRIVKRPVMRRELAWWLGAHADHPVAMALRSHLVAPGTRWSVGGLLSYVSAADARAEDPNGRLQRIALDFACWGGSPARFWVGPVSADGQRCAAIDEWAVGLRVADEVVRLVSLDRRADLQRSDATRTLVSARHATLVRHLGARVGSRDECVAAVTTVFDSYTAVAAWAAMAPGSDDARAVRRIEIDDRRRHVLAVVEVWDRIAPRVSGPDERWQAIGRGSAVLPQTLSLFLDAAVLETETPARVVRPAVLRDVRRIPLRDQGDSRFGAAPDRADVGVDRVDALLRVFRMTPAARTNALLDSADELLGPVLRDATPIRALAADMRHLPGVRRAACIALALLGEDVGAEATALIASGDDAGVRAGLLASLLAGDGRLPPSVQAAARASSPMAALVILRLANGRLLSALG